MESNKPKRMSISSQKNTIEKFAQKDVKNVLSKEIVKLVKSVSKAQYQNIIQSE